MIIAFSNEKNLKDLKKVDLVVLAVEDSSPIFLSESYSNRVETIKKKSLEIGCQIIFPFYTLCERGKCICGIRIKQGRIVDLFGECFTKKYSKFRCCNKTITILFYYDLYGKRGKELACGSSLTIGIDNEPFDNLKYLNEKFFNKLILVGLNNKVFCENIKKIKNNTKMLSNIMYKI